MAQVRERDSLSSPMSSHDGAESFKGTPDTRLTAFSPDETASKSSNNFQDVAYATTSTPRVGMPLGALGRFENLDRDPFVTPSHQLGTRLSPTASTFSPFVGNIGISAASGCGPLSAAFSHDIGISRYLDISSSVPIKTPDVAAWLTELEKRELHSYGTRLFNEVNNRVIIQFTDIRDACSAFANVNLAGKDWKVCYVDPLQLVEDSGQRNTMEAPSSGKVMVLASMPQGAALDVRKSTAVVQSLVQSAGCLFAFIRRSAFPNGSFRAIAEFCDVSVAASVASCLHNFVTPEGIHVTITYLELESASSSDLPSAFHGLGIGKALTEHQQPIATSASPRSLATPNVQVQSAFAMYPLIYPSSIAHGMPIMLESFQAVGPSGPFPSRAPVSPSYPVVGGLYHSPPSPALTTQKSFSPPRPSYGVGRSEARRQNAMRVSRSSYHGVATHHNHVDIHRIRDGIDVRTTIMLRNIPNKVDQAMLKRIIDESSWGKYDFMYLRIDFANDCNVGYAFINFVDPLDIIEFVDARGNQRWNCFKSDKVAEISYATIQGKDCLVQKFRNSSVMLEASHYRPKLYFTSNGPMPEMAGQEEPFPEPDNQSKMKRSCENAEHVGLFTPNAGQHFRDEQRRRRSQYDRGTRLAALEEFDYETAIQHLYGGAAMP